MDLFLCSSVMFFRRCLAKKPFFSCSHSKTDESGQLTQRIANIQINLMFDRTFTWENCTEINVVLTLGRARAGAVAKWLVRWSQERALSDPIYVPPPTEERGALACFPKQRLVIEPSLSAGQGTALCSWAKHLTPIVPLSTQLYKWIWVLENLILRGNPAMDKHSIQGRGEILMLASC